MSAVFDLDIITQRSLDQIARELDTALHFLREYESLMPAGHPLLDSSYDDILKHKTCVEISLNNAHVNVLSFMRVFIGCPVYIQLQAISLWTFEFNYSIELFESLTDFKANIQTVVDSISAGEVIKPPAKMGWG